MILLLGYAPQPGHVDSSPAILVRIPPWPPALNHRPTGCHIMKKLLFAACLAPRPKPIQPIYCRCSSGSKAIGRPGSRWVVRGPVGRSTAGAAAVARSTAAHLSFPASAVPRQVARPVWKLRPREHEGFHGRMELATFFAAATARDRKAISVELLSRRKRRKAA